MPTPQSISTPAQPAELQSVTISNEKPSRSVAVSTEVPTLTAISSTQAPAAVISTEVQRSGETPVSGPAPQLSQPAKRLSPKIPITDLRVKDTHRLIASKYSETGTVLSRLTPNAATLNHLLELDDATNDRFLGEEGLLPGIGIHELVYGIRYAHIVNAAFTHASPSGGRFNSPARGAWYASLERSTSIAEIAFHKLRALEEIDWPHEEISTSDDYLADITSPFHDLRVPTPEPGGPSFAALPQRVGSATNIRGNPAEPETASISAAPSFGPTHDPVAPIFQASSQRLGSPTPEISATQASSTELDSPFTRYLRPGPIPRCYARPQHLADRLLARRSNGIIYPSVRRPGGTCLVVFRPALVYNVRRGARLELRLHPNRSFLPSQAREVPIPQP